MSDLHVSKDNMKLLNIISSLSLKSSNRDVMEYRFAPFVDLSDLFPKNQYDSYRQKEVTDCYPPSPSFARYEVVFIVNLPCYSSF